MRGRFNKRDCNYHEKEDLQNDTRAESRESQNFVRNQTTKSEKRNSNDLAGNYTRNKNKALRTQLWTIYEEQKERELT